MPGIQDKEYPIRTIHHLSSSGGTLISKCISAMPDVVMLSEINPCSEMGGLFFDPFDPLKHFQKKYPEISYKDADSFKAIFYERIKWVIEKCKKHQKSLVIRDHSHSDFLFQGVLEHPPVYSFLNELYNVVPIITLRNPIDSYLSMMKHFSSATDVKSFDEYCKRVLAFIEKYSFAEVFLYEDFVDNPDRTLQRMCEIYGIEYDPSYKNNFHEITLTGDSGRGSKQKLKEIKKLDRREYGQDFFQEVKESVSFKQICDLLGYQDDIRPPQGLD
ncbi:hypothetical protein [Desulfobacter postgatei]|uniref:hypothetical protein n=1 Tax=Desulfobacter postgatei TaxID=2293 RepID=UPI0012F974F6|nr:hypothetical protein [Desulfobacter postgatei]